MSAALDTEPTDRDPKCGLASRAGIVQSKLTQPKQSIWAYQLVSTPLCAFVSDVKQNNNSVVCNIKSNDIKA